jgi:hypothetical protein
MSVWCQCTKSLRSSPLRGGKSRETGSRSRKYSDRLGDKVNTIKQAYCSRATRDQKQQEDLRAITQMRRAATTEPVRQWQNCLDESASQFALICAVYISARKKLIHAMPLNTDQPISRATVVGCGISATRNYLKSHGPKTLIPLLCINRAKTLKLCTHSRSPLFEFPKSSTSYKSP